MKRIVASLALLAVMHAIPARAETIRIAPGPDAQTRLQSALIDAKPGDTVEIAAGRYELTDGLSLDVNGVTVRGAGPQSTILSFKGQLAAGEGVLVTSDDVVLRDFAVEDSRGDGIKSKGANRIVYHDIRVEWTGGPRTTNGAYGVYPVASRDVLIDRVTVRGASDAGIYVGQSENIIVRNSVAMYNVAGIEIENSYNADVYLNVAMHNTGGILVFDLPNLPKMGGHDVRVFSNRIERNDTPNFAPKGNIVASVPMGTGVLIMANRNVAVFANAVGENASANIKVISYPFGFTDPSYNPLPRQVVVRDNMHGRAGFAPKFSPDPAANAALASLGYSVLIDGLGEQVRIIDDVRILSLNYPRQSAGAEANPALATPPAQPGFVEPGSVILPPSMEAAIR